MSTLFGILNKNGEPIQHEWLDRMAAKTQLPNCQPTRTWVDGCFGFGITQRYETPQDHLTAQPLNDSTSGIHIVATGRLDYRDDLARKLGFDVSQLNTTADIFLMQLAWRKWQRDCALHLEGDWSMAVWDARARTLDLLRDSVGITALHYVDIDKCFAFSTRIDALLELPWVSREPNVERLVELLAVCKSEGSTTGFLAVSRLAPANRLNVELRRKCQVASYRDPFGASSIVRSYGDAQEQFIDVFEKAVESRMRSIGPVGVTLSSGFDSSSVAVAANRVAKNAGSRIKAYSAIPIDPNSQVVGRLANEAPIVRDTCNKLCRLDLQFSDASDVTPIGGMKDVLDACCDPNHAAVNHFWIISLLRRARKDGLTTMLTGQLGNATISWQGVDRRVWHDLVSCDFRAAWLRWKRQRRRAGIWATSKSQIVSPALNRFRLQFLPGYLAQKWIAQSFLEPSNPHIQSVKARLANQRRAVLMDARHFVLNATTQQANPFWAGLSCWAGISVRDPTADERVIRLCLNMPDEQFQSPDEQRLVAANYLRSAGLNSVVESKYKGLQAADVLQRLSFDRGIIDLSLRNLVGNSSVQRVLDVEQMKLEWQYLRTSGLSSSEGFRAAVWLRALSVAFYLCDFANNSDNIVKPV